MNEINEMKSDMVKNLAILLMEQNKNMKMNEALALIFLDYEIKNGKIG